MPRDGASARRMIVGRVEGGTARSDAVRFINETLKGPVAEIFRSLIPAFGQMSGAEFYDTVMASSELLHGCVSIFRRHRDAFRALLVDDRGRAVNDDFVRLRCGRSIHDIIAMILRTHAKRHFRQILGGDPGDPTSRAGRLYQAMSEYLIHDWQVKLVPHYAPMPLHKVQEMGPRLLDIREAELLDAITAVSEASPSPLRVVSGGLSETPPPLPPRLEASSLPSRRFPMGAGASRHAPPSFLGTAQEEFWWEAITDRNVAAVLGSRSGHEMRELVAAMAGVNDAVRSELFAGLSLSTFQAALSLATAFRVMGRNGFTSVFGMPGKPQTVSTIAQRLQKRNVNSRTELRALAGLVEGAVRG